MSISDRPPLTNPPHLGQEVCPRFQRVGEWFHTYGKITALADADPQGRIEVRFEAIKPVDGYAVWYFLPHELSAYDD